MSNSCLHFAGRDFSEQDMELVYEIIRMYPRLSRSELAATICEALDWTTHTDQPKVSLCITLLDEIERKDPDLVIPPRMKNRVKPSKSKVILTSSTAPKPAIVCKLSELESLSVEMVEDKPGRTLWNEYVHRYHPLGYKRPFGAHQRYFIRCSLGYLGCSIFSASAWALEGRDQWIGWSKDDRIQRLHLIINNTRFLIFPWVRIRNLASKILSILSRRVLVDWELRFSYRPVLLETFVDTSMYSGACYKAANWQYLGETTGRGRMDRYGKYLSSPKSIYVYPLHPKVQEILRGEVSHSYGKLH